MRSFRVVTYRRGSQGPHAAYVVQARCIVVARSFAQRYCPRLVGVYPAPPGLEVDVRLGADGRPDWMPTATA